jgi:hypothetical protein
MDSYLITNKKQGDRDSIAEGRQHALEAFDRLSELVPG